ncbi:hypothetical protein RSAG8_00010, partial [Rhizoctonia solani AG-8 WAC10335]
TTTRLVSSFSSPSNNHFANIMESKDRRTMHAARQHTLHSSDRRKSKPVRAPKSQGGSRPGSHFSSIDDSDDHVDYATHPDRLHDSGIAHAASPRRTQGRFLPPETSHWPR